MAGKLDSARRNAKVKNKLSPNSDNTTDREAFGLHPFWTVTKVAWV